MGGKVFNHPTSTSSSNKDQVALCTPRMSPTSYLRLRTQLHETILPRFYHTILTPREVPEKPSYGDVDVLVSGRRRGHSIVELAAAVGAVRTVCSGGGGGLTSFAVPAVDEENVYRQIDLRESHPDRIAWEYTTHCDGDLWMILGTILRGYGVAVSSGHMGLHVRIESIERVHGKKASGMFLTDDPRRMFEFLGWDYEVWQRGFRTLRELFDFISSTRFWGGKSVFEKEGLQAGDQKRSRKRDMYRRWVEEYLPSIVTVENSGRETMTRDGVLEEAIETFGKREEYEAKMKRWRRRMALDELKTRVVEVIPLDSHAGRSEKEKLGLVMRGLRNRIGVLRDDENDEDEDEEKTDGHVNIDDEEDDKMVIPDFSIVTRRHDDNHDGPRQQQPWIDQEKLLEWVRDNWETVWLRERQRVKREKGSRARSSVSQ